MRRNSTTGIAGIIIVIMLITQFFKDYIDYKEPVEPKVITNTVTEWDTMKIDTIIYKPQWKTRWRTKWDTFTKPVDTNAILQDYFTTYFYEDTTKLDSITITIQDSVSQNKIQSRSLSYELLFPRTTITDKIYINNREFYWGLGLQGTPQQIGYVGAELLYRSRNQKAYSLGLGLNQDMKPVLSGKLYWQLNFN